MTSIKEESSKQEIKTMQGLKSASESTEISEKSEPEKVNISIQSSNSSSTAIETNGIDNEDSINLTIGEDEENLLAEEVKKATNF